MTMPQPPSAAQIKAFTPSKYQQAIFDAIADPEGPQYIVVEAYAGSGKTTTLVKASTEYVSQQKTILFCAFNKSIAREIGERVAGRTNVNASTLHALGKRALDQHMGARTQVDKLKQYKLADRYIEKHHPEPDIVKGRAFDSDEKKPGRIYLTAEGQLLKDAIVKLYDFTRLTLTDYNDPVALEQMAMHYDIDLDDRALASVPQMIAWDEEQVRDQHTIDFTDMIYWPVKWGISMQKFDFVLVDEAQDLNRCQLELSMMCRNPKNGRMVFVGDRRQAIYGFAGADNKSVQNIIERTQATVLPLSICYRCDLAMIKLAQEVTPQIEARPNAGPGSVQVIGESKFFDYVKPNDMVLCRLTAPLISFCIDAIKRGIKARVEGRDIGKQLTAIVQKVAKREHFDYADFLQHLSMYRAQQVKMLQDKNADETAIESMTDRCEAVGVVYESTDATDPDELCSEIDALFDEENPYIKFATIHRSKGLEAETVFIIAPEKLPLSLGGWQQEQEWNLRYVAVTRAKKKLYIVGGSLVPGPYAQNSPKTELTGGTPAPQPAMLHGRVNPDLEMALDRTAFKHHGDEPDFDIDALRRGDGPNFWGETREEELDRVMRNTLAELRLHERENDTDSPSKQVADHVAQKMIAKQQRELNELKRLFESKTTQTQEQREQAAIDKATAAFPNLPEDEAINAYAEKRIRDAEDRATAEELNPALEAQNKPQARSRRDTGPNIAKIPSGKRTAEELKQMNMFQPEPTNEIEEAIAEDLDHMLSDEVSPEVEAKIAAEDRALLAQLSDLPEFETPVVDPLHKLSDMIASIDDPVIRQDAIEAWETLRNILNK